MQNAESLGALYIYIYIISSIQREINYRSTIICHGIRLLDSRFYRTEKNVCTANVKTSVIEKCVKQELNKIEIKEDLRNDEELSLVCDIEKIKRTSYKKVVRAKKREKELELPIYSLSFF